MASVRSGMDYIYDRLKVAGPITVADYMKECLISPLTGYYMQKDVFGAKGDYTTSPEISQIFGELLAVWVLADWMVNNEDKPFQLVELGPGRGTLSKDILRVFGQFKQTHQKVSLHLIEMSPAMSRLQEETLTGNKSTSAPSAELISPYKSCTLASGVEVHWYLSVKDVPKGLSYFIAHEFFDALPVHQFMKTPQGWREVMVDRDLTAAEGEEVGKALRFVLAPGPTLASSNFSHLLPEGAEQGELCLEGMSLVTELAERVRDHGGGALIADYGETEIKKHTLRSFKQHQAHDVLKEPGTADLTADVNYGVIQKVVSAVGVGCHGPMNQNKFLHKMGIRRRLEVLLQKATPTQAKDLLSGYEMLTHPEQMGTRYKFLALTPSSQHIPTPF
ncbi:hypothetical protein EMCRGX_G032458 [Ephydatia muelleri]